MTIIDNLIPFCKSDEKKKQIGYTCPTLIKTRWIYICDALNILKCYKEKIDILYM